MDSDDERHGKPAGAKAHYAAGEKPCDACREAARQKKATARAQGRYAVARCSLCGRGRRDDRASRGTLCHDCKTAGNVRAKDLDIDFDPPTWVRRGLIWVAA